MLRKLMKTSAAVAMTLCCSAAFAQHTVSITSTIGDTGTTQTLQTLLDNPADQIQGWSYGVCHNEAELTYVDATAGTTTATIFGGGPPDFESINPEIGGVTHGVVIDFLSSVTLGPGTGLTMLDIDYMVNAPPGTFAAVSFCDVLGTPPVTTVVVVAGASIPPAQINGGIGVPDPNQLTASHESGTLGASADVAITLNTGPTETWAAVQCSIQYDDSLLASTAVTDNSGAEYFQVQASGPGEIVFGLVMEFDGAAPAIAPLGSGTGIPIATLSFDIDAGAAPGVTPISFVDGLGMPPINNLLIDPAGGVSSPGTSDGSVTLLDFNEFVRGDCNNDTTIDIADGVYGINFLFAGGPDPVCDDACDPNDDGSIDVTDSIFIWNYLLLDGAAPVAPFPAAGIDPTTSDGLGCNGDADDA